MRTLGRRISLCMGIMEPKILIMALDREKGYSLNYLRRHHQYLALKIVVLLFQSQKRVVAG